MRCLGVLKASGTNFETKADMRIRDTRPGSQIFQSRDPTNLKPSLARASSSASVTFNGTTAGVLTVRK